MSTATELLVAHELRDFMDIAAVLEACIVRPLTPIMFLLRLPAADGSFFWLLCTADRYPDLPPAWQWCNEKGEQLDNPVYVPKSGKSNFFHCANVICAPWNRLAYKGIDARGPHEDWAVTDWKRNPHTGQCRTLSAMAIRIAIELRVRFNGRVEELASAVA